MARDLPDWGALSAQVTVHEMTDLGEFAVRLGSIVSHDRRGDVVWFDDFECGLTKWEVRSPGAGSAAAISDAASRNGQESCLMTASTVAGASTGLDHRTPYPVFSRLGFEYSFNLIDLGIIQRLQMNVYDGSDQMIFDCRYDLANKRITYRDHEGDHIPFVTGLDLRRTETLFHTWKLVVDPTLGEFVRLIMNDQEYDLTGIRGRTASPGIAPSLDVNIDMTGPGTTNPQSYVDDAIITQNEPE